MTFIDEAHPRGRGSAEQPFLGCIGVGAPVAVLLTDLRASPSPCLQVGRAQSLHPPGDVFCCLVKGLWWGGKGPWSSSPLFIFAGVRLSLGGKKSPQKLCLLGGKGTGFPPASLSLTQLLLPSKDIRWEPQRTKHTLLFSLPSLIWVLFSAHTTHALAECSFHFAKSNHPKCGSGSYDHWNKHLGHLKLYLTLEKDMLRI